MAVVARKLANGSTVYWVKFAWRGKDVWERSGKDKRAAQRLNERRKQEVKDGVYVPGAQRSATLVGQYLAQWADERKNRNSDEDRRTIAKLPSSVSWFLEMPLVNVRPSHVIDLVKKLLVTVSDTTGKPLSPKTVANIFGLVRTMFRDAHIAELVDRDPCVLPRGLLPRKSKTRRKPYKREDVDALTRDPRIPWDARVWIALAFYTGMREGEVCGRRWRDIDAGTQPLALLSVDSQYDGEPLKTDKPRAVPVHPGLMSELKAWRDTGFELIHCRKPKPDDFIVPTRKSKQRDAGLNHTKSSAYKLWRRACGAVEVENASLHATRNTFISFCRRGGARDEVIETITHNSAGKIIDGYTEWDWLPACEAVQAFSGDSTGTRRANTSQFVVEAPGIETGGHGASERKHPERSGRGRFLSPRSDANGRGRSAKRGARHLMREALSLALTDRTERGMVKVGRILAQVAEAHQWS